MLYREKILSLIDQKYDGIESNRERIFHELRKALKANKLCLFGAGQVGKFLYLILNTQGIHVDIFCDNNSRKWNQEIFDGVTCISLDELEAIKENVICIVSTGANFIGEIYNQLKNRGFHHVYRREMFVSLFVSYQTAKYAKDEVSIQIGRVADLLGDEHSLKVLYYKLFSIMANSEEWQTFSFRDIYDPEIYYMGGNIRKGDVIVDCGAYNGDTLQALIDKNKIVDFNKYICYEMDKSNFQKLQHYVETLPESVKKKIVLKEKGTGRRHDFVKYFGENGDCFISADGNRTAEIVAIDEDLKSGAIDFIKMDIEGSELDALHGAERTIRLHQPACAISVYHKFEDLWEIPLLMKEWLPEHRFILKHHNDCYYDTVLYVLRK